MSAFGELPEGWGLNHFSDMPHEEFQKLLTPSIATDGFLMVDPNDPDLVYDPLGIESRREKGLLTADDVPQSYSSISNNDVASIRNQGTCGSCYGFAGAAVAETTWSKMKGKLYTLSPMELAQCADMDGGEDRVVGGCHGGWTVKTLSYVKNNGIVKDSDYPYDMPYCLCGHCDETFHSECLTWPKLCPGDASKAALLEHDSKAEWYARGIDYYVLHDMQVKKNTTLTLDQQKEQLKINWCWPGRKCSSSNYGCCLRCIGGEIEERERARQLVNEHILKMEKAPEAQQQQQQQKIKISTESKPYVRRSLADTPGDEALPETFMLEDKDIDWNKIKQTTLALASDGRCACSLWMDKVMNLSIVVLLYT